VGALVLYITLYSDFIERYWPQRVPRCCEKSPTAFVLYYYTCNVYRRRPRLLDLVETADVIRIVLFLICATPALVISHNKYRDIYGYCFRLKGSVNNVVINNNTLIKNNTVTIGRQWVNWVGVVNILHCITKYLLIDRLSTRIPTTNKVLNIC